MLRFLAFWHWIFGICIFHWSTQAEQRRLEIQYHISIGYGRSEIEIFWKNMWYNNNNNNNDTPNNFPQTLLFW